MAERRTVPGHEQRAQAGDNPIRGTQVGCTLAPAIEDQQLMPDQHRFGDNATESTRPCQSGQGDDQMNEYDNEVAHPGNGINTSKTTALRPDLVSRPSEKFRFEPSRKFLLTAARLKDGTNRDEPRGTR
jgi:hypothetical protein